jgi:pimeloyl-ACP methyl ester carboxylesterase
MFTSGSDSCAAWLYSAQNADPDGRSPLIALAHGLTGTRRDRLGPFAERFSREGIAALVFDHRGFGDSTGEPDRVDPAMQLQDWRAAIAYSRALPGIDPDRIATFGSSLGGGNALAAAAEDRAVSAAISQVPFLDRESQAYRSAPRVQAEIEAAASADGHLPAVGQPHEAAFINAPGAEAGWRHVVAVGEDSRWRNRASAGWLRTGYSPIRHAGTLHCPWLVCVAEDDNVALPEPAIAAAERAPRGELRTYPGVGHFDIYDGPEHEAVVADEVEFLRRHLRPTA